MKKFTFLHLTIAAASASLLLQGCAAGPASTTAASAPASSVERVLSGNTLAITNRFGTMYVYLDPSGRFLTGGGHGRQEEGAWRATADSLCMRYAPRPEKPAPAEHCMVLKGRQVGESWRGDVDPRNGQIAYRLMAGDHVGAPAGAQPEGGAR